MSANQVPDLQQPSTSSGRTQDVENKRSKRKSSGKDAGSHSKKQKIERRTESDQEQNTLDEAADADETQRDDNEAAEDVEIEILADLGIPGNQAQPRHIQAEFNGGQEDNQANGRNLTPEEIERIKHPLGRNAIWQTSSIKPSLSNPKRTEERQKKLNSAYTRIRGLVKQAAKEAGKIAEQRTEAIITGDVQLAWGWKQEEFREQAEEYAQERIAEVEGDTERLIEEMTAKYEKEKEDLQKKNKALHKRVKDTEVSAERSVDQLVEKVKNMETKEVELKEKLESLEKENTEIKAELARAELAKDELDDTKSELVETTRAKEKAEAECAAKNEEMYGVEKYLNDQINEAAQKAIEDQEIIRNQGEKIEKLEKEAEEKQALEEKVEELKEEVKNKTKDKETLEGDLAGMQERLQDEETRAKKLRHDLTTTQNEMEVNRQKIVKQKKTIKDHKEEITQIKKNKMSANILKEMLDEKKIECETLRKSKQKLEERMTAQLIIEDEQTEQTEETEEETEETEEVEEPDDSEQEEPGYDESAGEATDETDDEQEN